MRDLLSAFRCFNEEMAHLFLRKPREPEKKRLKVFDIDGNLLLQMFQDLCTGSVIWHPKQGCTVRMEGIPEGVKVVDVISESFGGVGRVIPLIVEHESFPEVEKGYLPEPLKGTFFREQLPDKGDK